MKRTFLAATIAAAMVIGWLQTASGKCISQIERDGSWTYLYDENGKRINTRAAR